MEGRDMQPSDSERHWMARAVSLGKLARPEPGRWRPAPAVGAVLVRNGDLLGEAFRGEGGDGRHAEFLLLHRLQDLDLTGATLFTTLEPCSVRNPPKVPCAQRLVDRRVATVAIGIDDPNPQIFQHGRRLLVEAGVDVVDFPADLRRDIGEDNAEYLRYFAEHGG